MFLARAEPSVVERLSEARSRRSSVAQSDLVSGVEEVWAAGEPSRVAGADPELLGALSLKVYCERSQLLEIAGRRLFVHMVAAPLRLVIVGAVHLTQASSTSPGPRGSRSSSSIGARTTVAELFSEPDLLRRPLLDAIDPRRERAPVLLIDELDRADEAFESFLLELLSDFRITNPERDDSRSASAVRGAHLEPHARGP